MFQTSPLSSSRDLIAKSSWISIESSLVCTLNRLLWTCRDMRRSLANDYATLLATTFRQCMAHADIRGDFSKMSAVKNSIF